MSVVLVLDETLVPTHAKPPPPVEEEFKAGAL
jgi:hypothetical protein